MVIKMGAQDTQLMGTYVQNSIITIITVGPCKHWLRLLPKHCSRTGFALTYKPLSWWTVLVSPFMMLGRGLNANHSWRTL